MSSNTQTGSEGALSAVALALGANLGRVEQTFAQAVAMLRAGGLENIQLSSVYKSKAEGCHPGTPDFSNSALTGLWGDSPQALLRLSQDIEVRLGRPREHDSRASRSIDIDLLLFAQRSINELKLAAAASQNVPPPLFYSRWRNAPHWRLPGSGKTVAQCLQETSNLCVFVCLSVLGISGSMAWRKILP